MIRQRAGRLDVGNVVFVAMAVWVAVSSTAIVRLLNERSQPQTTAKSRRVQDWAAFATRGYSVGPASAATTVVVFSSFLCRACQVLAATLDTLRERYPNVRIVERHFLLPDRDDASFPAALAAECAGSVGRYAEMRNQLAHQIVLVQDGAWGRLGAMAGISDTNDLKSCVRDERHAAAIQADVAAAKRLGVTGYPAVMINDSLLASPPSLAALDHRLSRGGP